MDYKKVMFAKWLLGMTVIMYKLNIYLNSDKESESYQLLTKIKS